MTRVAIVTDSASDLDPASTTTLGVTVIPLAPQPAEPVPDASGGGTAVATRCAPPVGVFVDTYERLALTHDGILSLHVSSRLGSACEPARVARQALRGVVPIEVIDSGAAGLQLGFAVERVARAARRGADLAQLARLSRQACSNVHAMFFAESLDQISRSPRWGRDRAWPIHGNGTRPLLYVEDGELKPLERVRTKARGYDRLAEFVELFSHVDALGIFHDLPASEVEMVVRRIAGIFPRERIIFGAYGPTLRSQLGPHAIGVFVDQGIAD
jgi:DegV family protein with EDD domain